MGFSIYNYNNRVRILKDIKPPENGKYILYWMQAYRRMEHNHSLDFAFHLATKENLPLVIYEGLRMDYKWNSKRIHKFILEGMIDNILFAKENHLNYWAFVESPKNPARGILRKVTEQAFCVITDDFPAFIIPEQIEKVKKFINCPFYAVDSNSTIPLNLYGEFASAARILRPRVHKLFPESFIHFSKSKNDFSKLNKKRVISPFKVFSGKEKEVKEILDDISFENKIEPVVNFVGGRKRALELLDEFINKKLIKYGVGRSNPDSPENTPVTGISPYLHFGHISVEEITNAVLNYGIKAKWAPDLLNEGLRGKREGYFHKEISVNSFLDELLTWRDIGYLMFWKERSFNKNLKILPEWLKNNLETHKNDKREFIYSKSELENSKTHDIAWNAAQTELKLTGRMHNYLRMLWGKKLIEWTKSYEIAFSILEDFNNKYAYDGRNPNSYTGILWCFGLFDRPWFPERNIFGNIRYMSSDSTMKKFKMKSYINYIDSLTGEGELFGKV